MSPETTKVAHECLRRIDESLDLVLADVADIKASFDRMILRIPAFRATAADLHSVAAGQSSQLRRIEQRLERIERRLDLTDAPA